jgi:drug/metabolite transporter (DMT)-like permease
MHPTGPLAILVAATLFGTSGVFVKSLALLPSTAITALRLVVPFLLLFSTQGTLRRRLFSRPNKTLLFASAFTSLRIFFWVLGLVFAPMSKAICILYIWPILFTLLNGCILKERVLPRTKLLLLTAFAGILIMYSAEELSLNNRDLIGMSFMFLVACINAGVLTVFKREMLRHSPLEILMYDSFVGAIIFLPFLIYYADRFTPSSLLIGSGYGITIGLVAYGLLFYGLSKVRGSIASVLTYMEVVVTMVLGAVIFHEQITWRMLIGGSMIVFAAVMVRAPREETA